MKLYLAIILCITALAAQAQIMQHNSERTKLEAQIESRPHSTSEDMADGNLYGHVYLTHNFIFNRMTKLGFQGRYEANNGGNTYFRFGGTFSHNFTLKNKKVIALNANLFGEASQYNIEHFDGHIVGIYMYKATREQQGGIGIVGLLNNPSGIPCVPIFIYNKQFSSKTSLSFMTYLASLNYDFASKWRFCVGYSMCSQHFWVKDDDGKRYLDNKALFSPQVVLQWNAMKEISIGAYAGYDLTITHNLYSASGRDKIKELDKKNTPFFAVRGTLKL